jgi:cobalt-precorrin 5A hydrolase
MKIAIISTTKNGDKIANLLKEELENKYSYYCYTFNKDKVIELKLYNVCEKAIKEFESIVFISSTGIAVRGISSFIKAKNIDPGVVVVDSLGKYAISLLSGHLGGANDLTKIISSILNSKPIITTATDNLDLIAPDMIAKYNNLIIDDLKTCKNISSLLINGANIGFIDDKNLINLPNEYSQEIVNSKGMVIITNKLKINDYYKTSRNNSKITNNNSNSKTINNNSNSEIDNNNSNSKIANNNSKIINNNSQSIAINKPVLKLIRKDIILGIGCKKNYNKNMMKENVIKALNENNVDIRSVKKIATVNIKSNEEAILELSKFLNATIEIFSIDQIKEVENHYNQSDFVKKAIGVGCICEPVIELSKGKIIVNKLKLNGMTLSIGIL